MNILIRIEQLYKEKESFNLLKDIDTAWAVAIFDNGNNLLKITSGINRKCISDDVCLLLTERICELSKNKGEDINVFVVPKILTYSCSKYNYLDKNVKFINDNAHINSLNILTNEFNKVISKSKLHCR